MGSGLLYGSSGTTNIDSLYVINSIEDINSLYKSYYIDFCLLIFSIGFLFKVSAAPDKKFGKFPCRVQLSNSRDILKILIPSVYPKINGGWINYSCMVISQNIFERLMDYRGSKLVVIATSLGYTTIKEQRVYGSYKVLTLLRSTLTDFERNYRIKIPSKQINKSIRFYSTSSNTVKSGGTLHAQATNWREQSWPDFYVDSLTVKVASLLVLLKVLKTKLVDLLS